MVNIEGSKYGGFGYDSDGGKRKLKGHSMSHTREMFLVINKQVRD